MAIESHHLSILTSREIDEIFGLPRFTEEERRLFFDLSSTERDVVDAVRTTSSAVHLVLQCGYFKAKRRFFVYEFEAVQDDLQYIVQRYFSACNPSTIKALSKPTRLKQQRIVLRLFDSRLCDRAVKGALKHKAQRLAMLSTQPIYIFREILQYLDQQRIVVPAYTFLQDLVGRTVTFERQRIAHLLGQALTPAIKQQLKTLLQADEGMYRISMLKHEPKDFSYKEMRREVERRQIFQPLHEFASAFLATTGLSRESVKYYASLVQFYTVYKLKRIAAADTVVRLFLLCFAYHRFRQINDHLVDAFIHLVDQYEQDAKLAAREEAQRAQTEASEDLKAAGQVLNLFIDESIPDDATFAIVKERAFSLLEAKRFPAVSAYMRSIEFDRTAFEWAYYAKLSLTFKRNLRQLFTDLTFADRVEDAPLLAAVVFLQDLLRQGKSPRQTKRSAFPVTFIPKNLHRYLFAPVSKNDGNKCLDIDRYEFMVYRMLRNALEAGNVFVRDSTEFRRFEDDLVSDARWQDKEAVLREIGAPILLAPINDTMAAFRESLEAKFKTVNQRIASGENRHIKIRGKGDKRRWSLIYPDEEESSNSSFYSHLPGIGIADLLWFVAERTGFLGSFTHVLDRYVKHEADPREILACVVAMGTNMGIRKMAEVSGLSYLSLLTTARNYLRLETLREANDVISNAIAKLPVFHLYDIQDVIHSSSDGQRIETQIDTINARYSRKYFGLKKGVSAYTMLANHVPINSKIIGADEHESHYVFDLLYNNTTDIKPDRHSTDTHGTNQVNFWILYVFGYRFAPRYRDLYKKIDTLVGFQHPKHYAEYLIKPTRKVLEALIIEEWPNIQRIMASLAQKDVTQATIVRKLSSYARKNQTKKALWELDNICRTLYILDFIDDVVLRQNVQKALNRGEAYHRFRRAIAYVNSGKFRVKTETEQQIWNECSRLIANAIIYYNAAVLSRVYEQKKSDGDQAAMDIIQGISLVAWQHVNLFGKFEFSLAMSQVNIEELAARYNDPVWWNKILHERTEDTLRN